MAKGDRRKQSSHSNLPSPHLLGPAIRPSLRWRKQHLQQRWKERMNIPSRKKLQTLVPRREQGSTTGARARRDMTAHLDCPTPRTMEFRVLKIRPEVSDASDLSGNYGFETDIFQ